MNMYETQEWESSEMEGYEMESESFEWESELGSAETELVNELLEVTSEQELEQFLGKLFRRAAKAVGGAIKSPVGKALGGVLKNVAKTALPLAGAALGTYFAPGVGTQVGSKVGSMAAQMFELEMEGMDEQEAEFEVARRFVKLADTAARRAAHAPRSARPRAVAKAALTSAARRHAPGLLRDSGGGRRGRGGRPSTSRQRRHDGTSHVASGSGGYGLDGPDDGGAPTDQDADDDGYSGQDQDGGGAQSGRWVRQDGKIVVLGA